VVFGDGRYIGKWRVKAIGGEFGVEVFTPGEALAPRFISPLRLEQRRRSKARDQGVSCTSEPERAQRTSTWHSPTVGWRSGDALRGIALPV